jgi:predicted Abi (CAAX) family protease
MKAFSGCLILFYHTLKENRITLSQKTGRVTIRPYFVTCANCSGIACALGMASR